MLLTICLDDSCVEITRHFYERLNCQFFSEKHGDRGLPHYAAVIPSMPIEIYPRIKGLPSEDRLFIGFTVDRPEDLKVELIEQCGGSEGEPAIPTTKSGIVTLRDPNGILVRLFPKV